MLLFAYRSVLVTVLNSVSCRRSLPIALPMKMNHMQNVGPLVHLRPFHQIRNDGFSRMLKESFVTYLRHYFSIFMKGLRKAVEIFRTAGPGTEHVVCRMCSRSASHLMTAIV
jgi:hypothetical protein